MRKDADGHWQIWTATARLTKAWKLTARDADSGWPVWSPDGAKPAFDSSRSDPNPKDSTQINDVFVMSSDGTHVIRLTDTQGASADAAWSPNGRWIAFDANRGDFPAKQGIYLMRNDGTGLRRITTLPAGDANDLAPRFAPDGSRLVFTRYRGKGRAEKAALLTVRVGGTRLRQLTPFALHAGDADWSPDGKRIAFEAYPDPDAYGDVYVVSSDGGHATNLTRNVVNGGGSADPVWSPDGHRIFFLDKPFRERRRAHRTGDDESGRHRPQIHLADQCGTASAGLGIHP